MSDLDLATQYARKSGTLGGGLINVRNTIKVARDMYAPGGRLRVLLDEALADIERTLTEAEAETRPAEAA